MGKITNAMGRFAHFVCGTKKDDGGVQPKEIISYSIAGFGQNLICSLITTYLILFLTDGVQLPAIWLAWLFLGARLFDAFNDPIMGSIVDYTRTKWGKLRPYVMFGSFPVTIFTILCFIMVGSSQKVNMIWASSVYVIWSIFYTIVDVPYWGLSTALSPDTNQRSNILMVARLFCTVGAGLITIVVPFVQTIVEKAYLKKYIDISAFSPEVQSAFAAYLNNKGALGDITDAGFSAEVDKFRPLAIRHTLLGVAVVISIIAIPLFYLGFKNTKERFYQDEKPKSLAHNLGLLFKNKPLLLIALSGILGSGRYIYLTSGLFYAKYMLQNEGHFAILTLLVVPGGLIASLLTPLFTKKLGKKWTYIITHIAGGLLLLLLYFVGIKSNGVSKATIILGIGVLILLGIPSGFANIMTYALISDTVDYFEDKYGERGEGIFFAIQTFMSKVGMAACAFIVLITLGQSGYTGDALALDDRQARNLWLISTLIPALSHILSAVPLFFYKFDEDAQRAAVARVAERRELKAAESAQSGVQEASA